MQHRSLPDPVNSDAGQRSGKEARAVAHRVDLVPVRVLEGCPHRHPAPVAESELGEQRGRSEPDGEQGDIVGHLSVVTDELALGDLVHHAPGMNGHTACFDARSRTSRSARPLNGFTLRTVG